MPRHDSSDDDFPCPNCGAYVPAGALFCRECGASDDSGWGDDAEEDELEDDFDYDDYVRREFPQQAGADGPRLTPRQWLARLIILLLLLCFVVAVFAL